MNYQDFSFRISIDWVEVRFSTIKPTNFWTVKRRFKKMGFNSKFVKPVNRTQSGAADVFTVRFHDVVSFSAVQDLLLRLNVSIPLILSSFRFTRMEFSLDAQPKIYDLNAMAEMATHLIKFNTSVNSENMRLTQLRKKPIPYDNHVFAANRLLRGYTIVIGNQDTKYGKVQDPTSHRAYVKVTDQKVSLPRCEHRARFEPILFGSDMPFTTFEEAAIFDYRKLSYLFQFRKIKPSLNAEQKLVANRLPAIGIKQKRLTRTRSVVLYDRSTVADTVLNKIGRNALTSLNKRMKR